MMVTDATLPYSSVSKWWASDERRCDGDLSAQKPNININIQDRTRIPLTGKISFWDTQNGDDNQLGWMFLLVEKSWNFSCCHRDKKELNDHSWDFVIESSQNKLKIELWTTDIMQKHLKLNFYRCNPSLILCFFRIVF